MAWTQKQKYAVATTVVVILLIIFLWYYFRSRRRGEKCPDGRDIPNSGNCSDNPSILDSTGAVVVTPVVPDANGCVQPSSYITNAYPLTLGMKGDLVKMVQIKLNTSFLSLIGGKLKEDGYLGCNTFNAIKKAWNIETIDAEFFKNNIQPDINTNDLNS